MWFEDAICRKTKIKCTIGMVGRMTLSTKKEHSLDECDGRWGMMGLLSLQELNRKRKRRKHYGGETFWDESVGTY